jgi:hypothetical protein
MFPEEELLSTKSPIRYSPEDKIYWSWFRHYENPPLGFLPSLLPVEVFDKIREQEGLAATDEDGNPPYAIGFDTEEEAWEAAIKAVLAISEQSDPQPTECNSSASAI